MIYLIVPAYLLTNGYILWRTIHWVHCYKKESFYKIFGVIFGVLYSLMVSTAIIAYFLPENSIHRGLNTFSNYFQGTYIYLLTAYIIVDLLRFELKHTRILKEGFLTNKAVLSGLGTFVFTVTVGASILGSIHAHQIYVKQYEAQVDKAVEGIQDMKVVLIADTHLGYSVGADMIEDMVNKINAQNPDLVVFAGDIFDNTIAGIDDPERVKADFRRIQSKYGVYACWGNHDVSERLFSGFSVTAFSQTKRSLEMENFVRDSNIHMLADESVLIQDSFYLVGRKDYEKAGDGTKNRESIENLLASLDHTKPIFVIDHEPRFLQQNADAGVDVMLSGHTHNGQFAPLNLGVKLLWENPAGMLKKDHMYSVVTSGVGVYGPFMRFGTDADITVVNIRFQQSS